MVVTEQSTVEQSTTELPAPAVQNYATRPDPDIDTEIIYTGPSVVSHSPMFGLKGGARARAGVFFLSKFDYTWLEISAHMHSSATGVRSLLI